MFKFKRSGSVVLIAIILSVFATVSAGEEVERMLELVPHDALLVVRVNNFNMTLQQIDGFIAGVSPFPIRTSAMLPMQLGQIIGNPQLAGLDTNGTTAIYLTAGIGNGPPKIHILAPTTDFELFINSSEYIQILSETPSSRPRLKAVKVGQFALLTIGIDPNTVANDIKSPEFKPLSRSLDDAALQKSSQEPIWIYGNIEQINESYGEMLREQFNNFKDMIIAATAAQNKPGPDMSAIMRAYFNIIDCFLNQADYVTLAINPKPERLRINETIAAREDTLMASMFEAAPPLQKNNLLGYLENGAAVNCTFRTDSPLAKMCNNVGIGMIETMTCGSFSEEQRNKLISLVNDASDSMSGPAAISMFTNAKTTPPFSFKYALTVADKDLFNKVMNESVELTNSGLIQEFYKSFGMNLNYSIQRNKQYYKGVAIDWAKLTIGFMDQTSPESQILNAMYGDGFNYRWAVTDGLCVMAIGGGDIDPEIWALIDQAKSATPPEVQSEITQAITILPSAKDADFFSTFNIIRFMDFYASTLKAVGLKMPDLNFTSNSNMIIAGKAENGKLTEDLVIPKQHLIEITQMIMLMVMQQQMPPAQ